MRRSLMATLALLSLLPLSIASSGDPRIHSTVVTATAYTMAEQETKEGHIGLSAWGDQLKPGIKAIAVSRDLIPKGLTHGTKVTIEGLDGEYRVLDKMNRRWTDKIDIFMGHNRQRALNWGRQDVTITWAVSEKGKEED